MQSFEEVDAIINRGRNKRTRPVANNTWLERRDEDTIALRLHQTDVTTWHRDGRITLNSGGWRTVTTKDRIPTRHLYAEQGVWYVTLQPDPNDPEPDRAWRTVPRPFEALDPGPEPVKSDEGCIAGTITEEPFEEEALVSQRDIDSGAWREEDIVRPYEHDSDYFVGYAIKRGRDIVRWCEHAHETWSGNVDVPSGSINDRCSKKQCPHCNLFERQHQAWHLAMNGGWGRERGKGYRQMTEQLEAWGSREAWHEAYLKDFREVRDARKAEAAWRDRNRILFFDGMQVDQDGYALRTLFSEGEDADKLRAITRQKREIGQFVTYAVNELEAGNVAMPGNGDCWFCLFSNEQGTMGDLAGDHEHLQSHIDEKYVVPSMLVNAMRERGYQDVGIYMMLGMDHEAGTMGGPGLSKSTVARTLRAYLQARLVPDASGSAPTGAALRETGLQTGGR